MEDKINRYLSSSKKPMAAYKYHLYYADGVTKTKGSRWRCKEKKTCTGKLFTDNNDLVINVTQHNHGKQQVAILRTSVRNKIDEYASATNEASRDICTRILEVHSEAENGNLQNLRTLRNRISAKRKANLNLDSLIYDDIPEVFKKLVNGTQFLQFDSGYNDPKRFVIFSTYENLSILKESNCWIMDGTFRVASPGFEQLYVIQTKVFNVNSPLVYILMTKRSSEDYNRVFAKLRHLTSEASPDYIIIDFEMAVINSLKLYYPTTKTRGCLFHFGQAIWRNIGKLGLASTYLNDEQCNSFFRMFLSLPFVPVRFVKHEFNKIVDSISAASRLEVFREFIIYFQKNYVGSCSDENHALPRYDISFWNSHERVLNAIPRTTNSLEGWNRSINDAVRISHPNIVNLIISLRKEQVYSEKKLGDASISPKLRKICPNDEELLTICRNYSEFRGLLYLKRLVSFYRWKLCLSSEE